MTKRALLALVGGLAAFAFAGDVAESGLGLGEKIPMLHPMHISGPNKGKAACPI
ncbi:MAG: hypothetical protein IIC73_04950 [Armatimonadetes bacterium]|nr:hypothetical protein [Armatimonadota bacterium]